MRRYFKKQYQLPSKRRSNKPAKQLVQPEWDDTIHDLSQLKLSPDDQLRRRLSRISHNQLGVAVLSSSKPASGAGSARYTPTGDSIEAADLSDSDTASSNDDNLMLNRPGQRQQQHQQQQQHGGSDSDSDDDVCQWQGANSSPLHNPRPVLHDIGNSTRVLAHRHSQQQKQQHKQAAAAARHESEDGRLMVESGVLQMLLDKIEALELQQQRHAAAAAASGHAAQQQGCDDELRQQLCNSQQQLSATQQQLAHLQEEYKQYVAHSSSLLTRLQAQLQQLMGQVPGLMLAGQAAGFDNAVTRQPASIACWENTAAAAAGSNLRTAAPDAWQQQSPRSSSPLAPAAIPGIRSSISSASRSPAKSSLRPATAVSVTALPRTAAAVRSPLSVPDTDRLSSVGCQPAVAAEVAALPSYAEMRQRRFADRASLSSVSGSLAAGGSSTADRAAGDASHAAYQSSMLSGSSQYSEVPYSRAVPPPIPAYNAAAAAAAALSGGPDAAAEVAQQQQVPGSWSNAAQVAPVMAAYQQGPAAALSPALPADSSLPGLKDVDWGLLQGLPRAAVGRMFTAAGIAEGVELPKPLVRVEQLRGNMSLTDHLRAAKAAASSGARV